MPAPGSRRRRTDERLHRAAGRSAGASSRSANELLYRAGSTGMFELTDATRLDSGVVILSYHATAA